MILDVLQNAERYFPLHRGFQPACEFLRQTDFTKLAAGKHDVDGDRLFLMLNQGQGRGRRDVKLEVHRQYIDIQFTIVGPDEIGWKPLRDCMLIDKPFNSPNDYGLFADLPETWVAVPPGSFAIFFPDDAHAPMGAAIGTELRKAVMKVAVDWR